MRILVALSVIASLAACGGDTDYLAADPAEAAEDLAQAACAGRHECISITISCDPPEAMYSPYPSEAACVGTLSPIYADLFLGCRALDLTDDERDALNACFNVEIRCIGEDELADYAAAVCAGEEWRETACSDVQPLLQACFECGQDPTACAR
jgi:hypothetical protein